MLLLFLGTAGSDKHSSVLEAKQKRLEERVQELAAKARARERVEPWNLNTVYLNITIFGLRNPEQNGGKNNL